MARRAPMTVGELRALKGPCERAVGGCPGLIVRVLPSGVKAFALRAPVKGRVESHRIGIFETEVTLEEARERGHELRKRLKAGEDPRATTPGDADLAETVTDFMKEHEHQWRPRTRATYSTAVRKFLSWAEANRVRSLSDLTRERLNALRNHLATLPRHVGQPGGKRGSKRASEKKRSPHAANYELRTVSMILNALRRQGRLPHLDSDAIADNLKALPTPREQPVFLSPAKIAKLLAACEAHDAETFRLTRDGSRETARHEPIRPFTLFLLLSGCRRGEALRLRWSDVDLDALDHQGREVGEIRLLGAETKTGHARTIGLEVSPMLRELLVDLQRQVGKNVRVFEGLTEGIVDKARQRLLKDFDAPPFTWQALRSTASTYLINAPSIFGAASVFLAARQLGHSVEVAEKHYAGVIRGIPADATTLEQAMRIA